MTHEGPKKNAIVVAGPGVKGKVQLLFKPKVAGICLNFMSL